MKYKKIIKVTLIFLAVISTFISCTSIRNKKYHQRYLQTELNKYADVLDINRTEMNLEGFFYYTFSSSEPYIKLSLYLKPGRNNRETIIKIRDDLISFFDAPWKNKRVYRFPSRKYIDFLLDEDGEIKNIYSLYHSMDLYFGEDEWFERWWDNSQDNPGILIQYDLYGTPIIRKNIRSKEFVTFLENHADALDIEHSSAFFSGTGFIRISIYLTMDNEYNQKIKINKIYKELREFLNTYYDALTEEYGFFDRIAILFYKNTEAKKWTALYFLEESKQEGDKWYYTNGW